MAKLKLMADGEVRWQKDEEGWCLWYHPAKPRSGPAAPPVRITHTRIRRFAGSRCASITLEFDNRPVRRKAR